MQKKGVGVVKSDASSRPALDGARNVNVSNHLEATIVKLANNAFSKWTTIALGLPIALVTAIFPTSSDFSPLPAPPHPTFCSTYSCTPLRYGSPGNSLPITLRILLHSYCSSGLCFSLISLSPSQWQCSSCARCFQLPLGAQRLSHGSKSDTTRFCAAAL